MIALRPPTLDECQQVRIWRNDPAVLPMLRTGYLTEEQQAEFYRRVANPALWRRVWMWATGGREHRYYSLTVGYKVRVVCNATPIGTADATEFMGLGGLTYLSRVPGEAEISLIIGPEFRGRGFGVMAVGALLEEASRLGLRSVIGECYAGGAVKFWQAMLLIQWRGWRVSEPWRLEHGSYHWKWERT